MEQRAKIESTGTKLRSISGNSINLQGVFGNKAVVKEHVCLEIKINGEDMPFTAIVAPKLTADIILGVDFMTKYLGIINLGDGSIHFDHQKDISKEPSNGAQLFQLDHVEDEPEIHPDIKKKFWKNTLT